MTNEEAISVLNDYDINFERNTPEEVAEAHEMAIKALEGQPNEDCIRRSDVTLTNLEILMCNGDYKEALKMLLDKIEKAPSVTPQPKEEQQPKTGHWIGHREHCEKLGVIPSGLGVYEWCSNCGHGIDIRDWSRIGHNYCPECGAKMQEVKK